MVANVIYRGPIENEPETINLPVIGAYLPGSFVNITAANKLESAPSGGGRPLILGNRRFTGQSVLTAYVADETGVAYRLVPDDEYCAILAAATYQRNQELSILNGTLRKSQAGDVVNFIYNEDERTLAAAGLADVLVANSYIKG